MHLTAEAMSTIESYYQEIELRKQHEQTNPSNQAAARQTTHEKSFTAAQDYQSLKAKKIGLRIGENRVVGVFLKTVEKKSAVAFKTPQENSRRTPWERFAATTVTGTVEGEDNSSVVLVLTEAGLNGSVKLPSEKMHYSLQGDSVSTYQIQEVPASTFKCGVAGNAK